MGCKAVGSTVFHAVAAIMPLAALSVAGCGGGGPAGTGQGDLTRSRQAGPLNTIKVLNPPAWQMVSSPFTLPQTFTQLGIYAAKLDPTSNSYTVTPNPPADQFQIGQGYWVFVTKDTPLNGPGSQVNQNQSFTIPLKKGWNQIGDPFNTALPLANVSLSSVSGSTPLASAIAAQQVSPLDQYDPAANQYISLSSGSQQMQRWVGFWIYTFNDASLVMLPPVAGGSGTGLQAGSPWPMFHHDLRHTGLGAGGASAGNAKWTFVTPVPTLATSSAAIAADGTIYIGAGDSLFALNPNGTQKWQFSTGIYNEFGNTLPAIAADGTIYIGGLNASNASGAGVFAIGPDGAQKWHSLLEPTTAGNVNVESCPAIGADGVLYVPADNGKLYALNPDGSTKWSFTAGALDSGPLLSAAIGPDGAIYVPKNDGTLYAVNQDGTQKWVFTGGLTNQNTSPSIATDGTIYLGTLGALWAINPDGTQKWKFNLPVGATNDVVNTTPAIASDGTIYVGTLTGAFFAIKPDGTQKWTFTARGDIQSSPAIASDGTIYFGDEVAGAASGGQSGDVYALNPDGTQKWHFTPAASGAVFGAVYAAPSIGSDGTVYIEDYAGDVYAID